MPKLELDRTSRAAAFETWLQRAALRIGGLHRKIEAFWFATQMATAAAYDQYLSLGPIDRPLVKVDSSWITPEQYSIELRLRPLILEAVPEVVRKSALSTRQTGVAELLFAAMIEAGPGTLRDREQTLKAVSSVPHIAVPDVYEHLQRWKFDLTRLMRLGMAPPDPTVQAATLRSMVAKMAEGDAAFQYRPACLPDAPRDVRAADPGPSGRVLEVPVRRGSRGPWAGWRQGICQGSPEASCKIG